MQVELKKRGMKVGKEMVQIDDKSYEGKRLRK